MCSAVSSVVSSVVFSAVSSVVCSVVFSDVCSVVCSAVSSAVCSVVSSVVSSVHVCNSATASLESILRALRMCSKCKQTFASVFSILGYQLSKGTSKSHSHISNDSSAVQRARPIHRPM